MTWDKLVAFWESIPGPIRTIVNTAVGLLITVGFFYVKNGNVDWQELFFAPLVTAVLRALNPVDQSYGLAPKTVQPVPDGGVQDVAP